MAVAFGVEVPPVVDVLGGPGPRECPDAIDASVSVDLSDDSGVDSVFFSWRSPSGRSGRMAMVLPAGRLPVPAARFRLGERPAWGIGAPEFCRGFQVLMLASSQRRRHKERTKKAPTLPAAELGTGDLNLAEVHRMIGG